MHTLAIEPVIPIDPYWGKPIGRDNPFPTSWVRGSYYFGHPNSNAARTLHPKIPLIELCQGLLEEFLQIDFLAVEGGGDLRGPGSSDTRLSSFVHRDSPWRLQVPPSPIAMLKVTQEDLWDMFQESPMSLSNE